MTIISRRSTLIGALLAATPAFAQRWPSRPIRYVVPFAAGAGVLDIMARIVAQRLTERLDQPQPLEAIDQPRHRAAGEPGAARDLARRRRAVQQDEVEALEVARIDPDLPGDRLAVQHPRRRGAAHRRHQAADQGLPALLTRFLGCHISHLLR